MLASTIDPSQLQPAHAQRDSRNSIVVRVSGVLSPVSTTKPPRREDR
jgi:hypothetical protein